LVHAQRRLLNQGRHWVGIRGDWQAQQFEDPRDLLRFAPKRSGALLVERSLNLAGARISKNGLYERKIDMNKLNLALAALIFVADIPSARADDSGHISINSLNAELPRSSDPLSPVSDGLPVPGPTDCPYARVGAKCDDTWVDTHRPHSESDPGTMRDRFALG
jgi:hypothetical protein